MSNKKTYIFTNFINGYYGASLLEKHSLDEYGFWEVLAADTNCDIGGSHYTPRILATEGKLIDVIRIAVEMPKFWAWGSGEIRQLKIVKTEELLSKHRDELLAKKKELEEELSRLDKALKF